MSVKHTRRAAIVRASWAIATLLFLFLNPGALLVSQTAYIPTDVHGGGTINGKVTLKGIIPKIDQMGISQDNKVCGKIRPSPRLVVGKDQGVADAIVYLEGISKGKKFLSTAPSLLDQHNCEYHPHVLIVPLGQSLQIVNTDPILHNVHTYESGKDPKTVFNIAQPVRGMKSTTKPLMKSGIVVVTCDAGHPWMSAHIMVADHPYYVITDKNGNFSLSDIPPGSYTLHMWHEGVAVAKKEMEHDRVRKYSYEPPYEGSKQVTVSPKAISTADFELTLR